MKNLVPGDVVKEIENKKFAANIKLTDFGPCAFCSWEDDNPMVSTCEVIGNPRLKHVGKLTDCATVQVSVCLWCMVYVRWIDTEKNYGVRCPACFPIEPEELTAVKLERESGEDPRVREARQIVENAVRPYVGQQNTEQTREALGRDIEDTLRRLHFPPFTLDVNLRGDTGLEITVV
jgi:hypothetical protein